MSNQELVTVDSKSTQVQSSQQQQVNPMQLVSMAVEQGADIDKLSKLMDLQERWESGQAKKAFDEAMNEFQSRMPVVPRRGKVDYTTGKGRTNYDYGRIEDAFALASPILKDVGLSFRFKQETVNGLITVTCIISHRMGHCEENSMSAMPDQSGGKDPLKAMASTNSYLRRYTFTGGFGIIFAGEDDEMLMQQNTASAIVDVDKVIVDLTKKQGKTDQQLFDWLSKSFKREIVSFDDMTEDEKQFIARKLGAKA
jgi:hypothetical protein